jgi:DNA-binding NarL/FixJ family response regulator
MSFDRCFDFVVKFDKEDQKPLPDILFLDINRSLKNGRECPQALSAQGHFDNESIVMYSTSDAQRDIDETYAPGADLYEHYPKGMEVLRAVISSVIFIYDKNELKHAGKEKFLHTA